MFSKLKTWCAHSMLWLNKTVRGVVQTTSEPFSNQWEQRLKIWRPQRWFMVARPSSAFSSIGGTNGAKQDETCLNIATGGDAQKHGRYATKTINLERRLYKNTRLFDQ